MFLFTVTLIFAASLVLLGLARWFKSASKVKEALNKECDSDAECDRGKRCVITPEGRRCRASANAHYCAVSQRPVRCSTHETDSCKQCLNEPPLKCQQISMPTLTGTCDARDFEINKVYTSDKQLHIKFETTTNSDVSDPKVVDIKVPVLKDETVKLPHGCELTVTDAGNPYIIVGDGGKSFAIKPTTSRNPKLNGYCLPQVSSEQAAVCNPFTSEAVIVNTDSVNQTFKYVCQCLNSSVTKGGGVGNCNRFQGCSGGHPVLYQNNGGADMCTSHTDCEKEKKCVVVNQNHNECMYSFENLNELDSPVICTKTDTDGCRYDPRLYICAHDLDNNADVWSLGCPEGFQQHPQNNANYTPNQDASLFSWRMECLPAGNPCSPGKLNPDGSCNCEKIAGGKYFEFTKDNVNYCYVSPCGEDGTMTISNGEYRCDCGLNNTFDVRNIEYASPYNTICVDVKAMASCPSGQQTTACPDGKSECPGQKEPQCQYCKCPTCNAQNCKYPSPVSANCVGGDACQCGGIQTQDNGEELHDVNEFCDKKSDCCGNYTCNKKSVGSNRYKAEVQICSHP